MNVNKKYSYKAPQLKSVRGMADTCAGGYAAGYDNCWNGGLGEGCYTD